MLNQLSWLFEHHFATWMCRWGLVEGGADDFAFSCALHVGDFLRAFVDQKNNQRHFRMVRGDELAIDCSIMVLPVRRRRDDQSALALANGAEHVQNAAGSRRFPTECGPADRVASGYRRKSYCERLRDPRLLPTSITVKQ